MNRDNQFGIVLINSNIFLKEKKNKIEYRQKPNMKKLIWYDNTSD